MATQAQQNEEVVREYLDCYDQRDIERLESVMAEDVSVTGLPGAGKVQGLEAYKEWAAAMLDAFADLTFDIEAIVSNDQDVAAVVTATAIHDGELMGIEATGKDIAFQGILYFELEDGKITRKWNQTDDLGLLQQLGAIPEEF